MVEEKKTEKIAVDEGTEDEVVVENEADTGTLLKDLIVLPPLSKKTAAKGLSAEEVRDAVQLPPIRAEEPVSSIRAALSEVCGFSHLTNYRLELEKAMREQPKKADEKVDWVASPYTGKDAVVSVPAMTQKEPVALAAVGVQSELVLDDYGDLTALLANGLKSGSAFRIVLERYDAASVHDHLARLRSLLDGNAPTVTSFVDAAAAASSDPSTEPKKDNNMNQQADVAPDKGGKQETAVQAEEDAKEAEKKQKSSANLPDYGDGKSVLVDGTNLQDFYYLACGEDSELYHGECLEIASQTKSNGNDKQLEKSSNGKKKNKKKAGQKSKKDGDAVGSSDEEEEEKTTEEVMRKTIPRLNALEEMTRVACSIRYSGYHPPPSNRKWMGDLAYLEVTVEGEASPIFITAIPTGFFINKSTLTKFNPSPAESDCFSHELLDCLLQRSSAFTKLWTDAMVASKERAVLMATTNKDGPFCSLFRVAVRGDFDGYKDPSSATASTGIDALLQVPSWLVPLPRPRSKGAEQEQEDWTNNQTHAYSVSRAEDDVSNSFGVDLRSGAVRDWNEELQSAREMPTSSLQERIERARVLHKVMTDFGEASVLGVKAIMEGQISSMNPNEAMRSQVYLHNNIFFSRAVDAGVETFKIAKGDRAARKSASRDVQCIGALHRMEKTDLHTLATVLIDYLGTRFVCQSILPGILSGEKTHTLLYGAVEAGSPLVWDQDMHDAMETTLGKSLMVASRKVPRQPLAPDRLEEIKRIKKASPFFIEKKMEEEKEEKETTPTIESCAPLEAKGIRGSDQRKYVLDLARLTPRDANWVPKAKGGTGLWESVEYTSSKAKLFIPSEFDDDEWTLAVLRPEWVTGVTKANMEKWFANKKKTVEEQKPKTVEEQKPDTEAVESSQSQAAQDGSQSEPSQESKKETNIGWESKNALQDSKLNEEDLDHLKSLRMNVNVFLPEVVSLEGLDDDAYKQMKLDEEAARVAAVLLWEQALPKLTKLIYEGSGHQIPPDGKNLTELLHQQGINCRYLGRLAMLAQQEEAKDQAAMADVKQGKTTRLERRLMPKFWLELLECEMVARAAKHVLDSYLTENGGSAATQPSQLIASFLSALVSEAEETAAQTESRFQKKEGQPDDEEYRALSVSDAGGDGDGVPSPIRGRSEVWRDIEMEVGRRFRYVLTLYNPCGKANRALYIPLLRRVCQRTGVRLAAKSYEVGGKCVCSGGSMNGGQLTASYPIAPTDVIDVVPLAKHSAAHGEGFVPCSLGTSTGLPSLHISLPDARAALEAAHVQCSKRQLSKALELAQEAANLYQRVTDTPAHPGVVRCIDLMATIFFDAGEPVLAAGSAVKALGLLVQLGGFDSADAIGAHLVLFQMLLSSGRLAQGVKHLRAAIYLMNILGGQNYVELANAYHKLGTVFHGVGNLSTALRFYQAAASTECCDRLLKGMIAKSTALVLAGLGQYKAAVEIEKQAFHIFSLILGTAHTLTKTSDHTLKELMKLAVEQGSRMVEDEKKRKEHEAAEAMASQIEADEAAEGDKKKRKPKKKKGKK